MEKKRAGQDSTIHFSQDHSRLQRKQELRLHAAGSCSRLHRLCYPRYRLLMDACACVHVCVCVTSLSRHRSMLAVGEEVWMLFLWVRPFAVPAAGGNGGGAPCMWLWVYLEVDLSESQINMKRRTFWTLWHSHSEIQLSLRKSLINVASHHNAPCISTADGRGGLVWPLVWYEQVTVDPSNKENKPD